ncbi:porin family protein [Rhodocista pekingensis]|uniref:Porin family protein n=1 Tax=Rhodocista pekingensis TaxID=201185 RepID=A0ABW2KQX0_9PROT
MKHRLAGATALVLLVATAPALAQGTRSGDSGPYIRGSLGYSWSSEDEIDYSPLWGIGAGYRINPNLRVDLTADWRDRYIVEGGRGFAAGGLPINSEVDNRTLMVNAYYDFGAFELMGNRQQVRPYLGAGIGLSTTKVDDVDVIIADQNRLERFFGSDDDQFSWQLMAGAQVETGSGLFFDLGYRYVDLGKVQLSSTSGVLDEDLRAHELVATLGYRF